MQQTLDQREDWLGVEVDIFNFVYFYGRKQGETDNCFASCLFYFSTLALKILR